jgi:MFS family permease
MDAGHRRLLWLLGLAIFFEGYGRSFVVITLSYVGRDLDAAPASLSYALALISAGSLGVLVLGPLADRFGRRRLLLASVLLYSLLAAATASAAALPVLVAWQAAARMFQEGALFAAAVIAAEEMPAAKRAEAHGLLGTANSLGSGLVGILLAAIERVPGGWRTLCLVSLVPLLALPLLARAIPESERWRTRSPRTSTWLPREYRGRLIAVLAVVFLGMSYDVAGFAFATYVPISQYGWSPAAASALIVVAGGVGLPGWWVGGQLADRYGRRSVAILFMLGLTLAELAFYLGGPAAAFPAFAVMVFCQGGKITIFRAWATELFPTSFRGAAAGWLSAGGMLGGMAGLAVAGALERQLGGIRPALAVVSAAGVAAAVVAWTWLPETRGLELEASAPEPSGTSPSAR